METVIKRGRDLCVVVATCATIGCGPKGEPPPQTAVSEPSATTTAPTREPVPGLAPSALPKSAVFSDLMRAAVESATSGESAECTLRRTDSGWRYEGVSEVLMRPAPTPTDDVFTQIEASRGRVAALTRRGMVGRAPLIAVTLGPLALEAGDPVTVVAVTHAGTFLRQTDVVRDEGPLALDELREAAKALGTDTPLLITASASVAVDTLASVLVLLQKHTRNVALGVVLPKGTRVPEPAPPNDGTHACKADPRPNTGDLTIERLAPSLESLSEEAARCYESLPAHAQLTWRVPMRLTIAADGSVADVCFEDATLPQVFESCLVSRSKAIAFPAPRPQGRVTFRIPLRFVPKERSTNMAIPVCL